MAYLEQPELHLHPRSETRMADVLERVDPIFYGDLRQAAFKALGLN